MTVTSSEPPSVIEQGGPEIVHWYKTLGHDKATGAAQTREIVEVSSPGLDYVYYQPLKYYDSSIGDYKSTFEHEQIVARSGYENGPFAGQTLVVDITGNRAAQFTGAPQMGVRNEDMVDTVIDFFVPSPDKLVVDLGVASPKLRQQSLDAAKKVLDQLPSDLVARRARLTSFIASLKPKD